jgi:hypothetical protein
VIAVELQNFMFVLPKLGRVRVVAGALLLVPDRCRAGVALAKILRGI